MLAPLIKYPGSKRWLVDDMQRWFSPYADTHAFVEPFAGSLALSFGLQPRRVIANDANAHVVNLYRQVQSGGLVQPVRSAPLLPEHFYAMRAEFNGLITEGRHMSPMAAELFYLLSKSGFNGLIRFNRTGLMNTPAGRYRSVNMGDFPVYREAMREWSLSVGDFRSMCPADDWFLVLDPPYHKTFTSYAGLEFGWDEQVALIDWVTSFQTGPVVITNSATEEILSLYRKAGFACHLREVRRSISCKQRRPALEVVAVKGFAGRGLTRVSRSEPGSIRQQPYYTSHPYPPVNSK